MTRSDLPFGSEFSPSQIDLVHLLELAKSFGSDWNGFEAAVRERYFSGHHTSNYNQRKLANNTKLSMRAYGLIGGKDAELTAAGKTLLALSKDRAALYEEFARHILLHCQGMNFVQCVLDMRSAGENINLSTLRKSLEERGLSVPRGAKHMSTLRLWLEKAGVFVTGYRVDHRRLGEILGLGVEEFEELARFSPEQKASLKTLANIGEPGPHASNDIERLATATYGTAFNEKNLPKQVLYPLEAAGYIDLRRGTKKAGRGAKPFLVTATDKLIAEVAVPLLGQLEEQVHAGIRPLLRKPLSAILEEMRAGDRHVRGLALEALPSNSCG